MNDTFALVFAGQGNPALRELIELRSVSALPIAGRYRVIDFLLSNLSNSGIHSVGLITQRNYKSLMDHIGSGKEWDLSRKRGGLMVLPPYDLGGASGLYHGTAEAIFAKRDYIDHQLENHCLLLDSNAIYRQDYSDLMAPIAAGEADATLLFTREAARDGDATGEQTRLVMDSTGRIRSLEVGAGSSGSDCVSLSACLVRKDLLVRLVEDACAQGRYDLMRDVLTPALSSARVVGVEHRGYVGHVDSVKSFFDVNMDTISPAVRADLFDPARPMYTKVMDAVPVRFGNECDVADSVFGNGCDIRGRVSRSVVFRGVRIEEGADVEGCIVMQNTLIGKGAHLRNVIIDKDVVVEAGTRIVALPDDPRVVRKGSHVGGGRA